MVVRYRRLNILQAEKGVLGLGLAILNCLEVRHCRVIKTRRQRSWES